jgi:ELWxxDGT repeat protein
MRGAAAMGIEMRRSIEPARTWDWLARRTWSVLASLAFLVPLGAEAGDAPFLVEDIDPLQPSAPFVLGSAGGKVFFAVEDLHAGRGLWCTDGTSRGTERLKEGLVFNGLSTISGDALYFVIVPDGGGEELWTTDGTLTGTTNLLTGRFLQLVDADGSLFFIAAPPEDTSTALWKTDGTTAGTMRLRDFPARSSDPFRSFARTLTSVNGTVFFIASAGEGTGQQLWRSDGSPSGTVPLTDPLVFSVDSELLTAVNGTLYFWSIGAGGEILWRSDGTVDGTREVAHGDFASQRTSVGDTLFFTVGYPGWMTELWRSDGTAEGTMLVKAIGPGSGESTPAVLTNVDGTVLFVADDGSGPGLWRSDGAEASTQLIAPVTIRFTLAEMEGVLYFAADDDDAGLELWRTDGTRDGTRLVTDINPGPAGSLTNYNSFTAYNTAAVLNGNVFFAADDGVSGAEIWMADGTEEGTVRITDLLHDTASANPQFLTDVDGTLYFLADDGTNGRELWRSDGSTAGTQIVRDLNAERGSFGRYGYAAYEGRRLTDVGGTLFFAADDGSHGFELWKSDGTVDGTVLVRDINPSPAAPSLALGIAKGDDFPILGPCDPIRLATEPSGFYDCLYPELVNVDGTLFFAADDGEHGFELWKSDGTEAGTTIVRDIRPGTNPSLLECGYACFFPPMKAASHRIFFTADDGTTGYELWQSDGTAVGTVRVADIAEGEKSSLPTSLTDVDGALYFIASPQVTYRDHELWKTDGTAPGTVRVAALGDGTSVANLIGVNGALLFTLEDDLGQTGLWRTKGGEPELLRVLGSGSDFMIASPPVVVADSALFETADGKGTQLWRSDGTTAGTGLVKSFAGQFGPADLTRVRGSVFFTVDDVLWRSNGTGSGTAPVRNFVTPRTYAVTSFTAAASNLFFAAYLDGLGSELWALPLPPTCRGDCNEDGTVTVAEIVTGVDVALDRIPVVGCSSLDVNEDRRVSIDELVAAVHRAMAGCS